jgi:Na+:H+ antiporter, NhaC family
MPYQLTLLAAVAPLVTMLVLFVIGMAFMDVGAELLILVMLGAATVASIVAVRVGKTWDDIQRSTGQKLADVLPALLILLSIGMLIGTWVLSGTIPMLVYAGLRVVDPSHLILTAFLATAVMSLCTGTSWGSAGTIGVALMGMGVAVNAPPGPLAGAIVSGAYFGDKLSPLSDSTNISAIGAGADLYAHVRHMLYTAVPSTCIAIVLYMFAARWFDIPSGALPPSARDLLRDIDVVYRLNWLTLLPPAVVVAGIVGRVPPVIAMAVSSAVACVLGIAVQGFAIPDALRVAVSGFHVDMVQTLGRGIDPAALSEGFRTLVTRGGLYSMMNTLLVVIAAFLLAGALDTSGALDLMINRLLASVRSVFGLIAATMTSGAVMIGLTSHGGVTALIVGGLFQKAYADRDLAPQNLSRSIEDSVTIVEPLMPWTVSAVFMATTLGVPTLQYAPWAAFCYCGPIFSLTYAAAYGRGRRPMRFGIKSLEAPA